MNNVKKETFFTSNKQININKHKQTWTNKKQTGIQPKERTEIYKELFRVCAWLHSIDFNKIGLLNYGKQGKKKNKKEWIIKRK